ncbi:ferritin-like domain-containing protein [Streptomyces sp. SP18CS02]|uniref:ferritin-like domain-containing protein n=1 Tax=Streptomyces sp. SP18CS02 TaxID=3002531 RepID=UPI002E780E27|nr:ferritin-like protein [Streptomyces sp. SP18CS02]MEE1754437.1 ferritin-like protein [Streptomyces sp. SP18CS02]
MTSTFTGKPEIVRLMTVPTSERDLQWLKEGLQAAVALELSTLPPYLCGYWSIRAPSSEAARLIAQIAVDEMFHMGLVSNMLTAIGGTPRIVEAATEISYPGRLPGGVRPQLSVYLSGLTVNYVKEVFMEIEMPEHPLAFTGEGVPTIGAFYDALLDAFKDVNPTIDPARQLTGNVGAANKLVPMTDLDVIEESIALIKEQGEGTPESPSGGDVPAHYYRFGELYHGHKLRWTGSDWKFDGDPVAFPDTYPMGRLTASSWPNPAPDVAELLTTFNQTYTTMLEHLDKAWETGSATELSTSIGKMYQLASPARSLMQMPLPDSNGTQTYGPEFLVVPT